MFNRSKGEKAFAVFNYIFLTLLALVTIYPIWDIIRVSLSTAHEASSMVFRLYPSEISWDGYREVIANEYIWIGYRNTIVRVLVGVSLRMTLMILTAYPLSKRYLPGRNIFTSIIVITMFFSGGLIPGYLNIKSFGIENSIWALVLPTAIDTFAMLILRNFFMELPEELEESAKIDGASSLRILARIILPLSMPVLMTIGLWAIVDHWNAWFDCLLYMRDANKFVLQAILRKIVIDAAPQFDSIDAMTQSSAVNLNVEVVKAATIVVSTLPVMLVYPFIQKYFVTGIMLGSLKG